MNIEELKRNYAAKKSEIKRRLSDFKKPRTSEEIFYELCYCVITAHGSAKSGRKAQECLQKNKFWRTGNLENCLDAVRYGGNKTAFLLHNRKNIIGDKIDLHECLNGDAESAFSLREKIAKDSRHFKGLGFKAASQFLRNIGFFGLAILDRHILKNLKGFGAIAEVPKSLTKKKYLEIEEKLNVFCAKTGIPVDEFDILIWTSESGAKIEGAK